MSGPRRRTGSIMRQSIRALTSRAERFKAPARIAPCSIHGCNAGVWPTFLCSAARRSRKQFCQSHADGPGADLTNQRRNRSSLLEETGPFGVSGSPPGYSLHGVFSKRKPAPGGRFSTIEHLRVRFFEKRLLYNLKAHAGSKGLHFLGPSNGLIAGACNQSRFQ